MIKIIAIGQKHDSRLLAAIADFEKRLMRPFNVEWTLLPYSAKTGNLARDDESARILARLETSRNSRERVLLLDERGEQLTSPDFSRQISRENLTIIIGGAYGVNDELRNRADQIISLSHMIFPHQLVRLILVEQIYRAQCISRNHPYHHE